MPTRPLIEAACLAHDLGHPPFGHGGEVALQKHMRNCGGFEGNGQTLRLLTRLEKYKQHGWGINPTRRLVLAVLKYPIAYSHFGPASYGKKPPKCYFDEEREIVEWALNGFSASDVTASSELDHKGKAIHRTFDSSVMELADDIAYGIHDIEDIVARRLADHSSVRDSLVKAFNVIGGKLDVNSGPISAEQVYTGIFSGSFQRKQTISQLVSAFITAVTLERREKFEHPLLAFRASLPTTHRALLDQLRDMAFHLVIRRAHVRQLEKRGELVVSEIFRCLREDPEQLVPSGSWNDGETGSTVDRRVCDYVAGMTDSYADRVYRRLFIPGFGSSSDEI